MQGAMVPDGPAIIGRRRRPAGAAVPTQEGRPAMPRTLASASEIRRLIQARLYASDALDGACRECHANQVQARAPDASGCNWDLHSYNGPAQCAEVVATIVAELQSTHNLA